MKKILAGLLMGVVFMSANTHALSCEVSFKAKKTNKERSIFGDIPDPEYKRGKVKGQGSTLGKCKHNALRRLKKDNWHIIYAIERAL